MNKNESELIQQIMAQFEKLQFPNGSLQRWKEVCLEGTRQMPIDVMQKLLAHIPTQEQINKWKDMPKDLSSLAKIKLPLLCGWNMDEVVIGMEPYLRKHVAKYSTNRCDFEDSMQNGAIGVIQALRTDAGYAAFATHCFRHIQTNIRRASVNSGVIRETEATPVSVKVRLAIGSFLSADWMAEYRDELAQSWDKATLVETIERINHKELKDKPVIEKNKIIDELTNKLYKQINYKGFEFVRFTNYQSILGNIIRDYVFETNPAIFTNAHKEIEKSKPVDGEREKVIDELAAKHLDKKILPDLTKIAEQIKKQIDTCAKLNAEKNREKYQVKTISLLNNQSLVRNEDFSLVRVQRTGNQRGRCSMIDLGFDLTRLNYDKIYELFDYLNARFGKPAANDQREDVSIVRQHIMPIFDTVKHRCVADIIKHIAAMPDFHKNPTALDVQLDGEERYDYTDMNAEEPSDIVMAKENSEQQRTIIKLLRAETDLTMEQECTLCFTYGLPLPCTKEQSAHLLNLASGEVEVVDGQLFYIPQPVSGSWLADNFGLVTGKQTEDGNPSAISRQRITQYLKRIHTKFSAKYWELRLKSDGFKRSIERALKSSVKLTDTEMVIAVKHFGLFGEKECGLEYLMENYETLTKQAVQLSHEERKELVEEHLENIRNKICAYEIL